MELTNGFPDYNLEDLCIEIIKNKNILTKYTNEIRNFLETVEENSEGNVKKSTLLNLIEISYKNIQYRHFLLDVVDLLNEICIDDEIFDKLFGYPIQKNREEIRIALSHKKLTERQLVLLCQEGATFECYFELAILYYTNPKITIEKLKNFFCKFDLNKFSYMKKDIIQELLVSYHASNVDKQIYISSIFKA